MVPPLLSVVKLILVARLESDRVKEVKARRGSRVRRVSDGSITHGPKSFVVKLYQSSE